MRKASWLFSRTQYKGISLDFLSLFQHKSPARRKYSFGSTNSQCSDDDNDSDVGSISSERSYSSRGSRNQHKVLEPGNVSQYIHFVHSRMKLV